MNKKDGLKKIKDIPNLCLHPEHNPPMHIVLEPGTYEYTCPGCGRTVTFYIPAITYEQQYIARYHA